jgi:hypothetical protein
VWTPRLTSKGPVYLNFLCDIGSLRLIGDKLSRGEFIAGEALETKTGEDSNGKMWLVTGRRPMLLGPQGVASIEPMAARLIEDGFELVNGRWL